MEDKELIVYFGTAPAGGYDLVDYDSDCSRRSARNSSPPNE